MTEPLRFRDTGQTIYDFGHSFLVHCPQCDRLSTVTQFSENSPDTHKMFDRHRLSCKFCGYSKDWEGNSSVVLPNCEQSYQKLLNLQQTQCQRAL